MSRNRSLWRSGVDALVFVGVLVLVLAVLQKFGALDIAPASVVVIDGDSLREGSTEIRLFGIDAPEYMQKCRDGFHKEFACGKRAAAELRSIVSDHNVVCQSLEVDRYGRAISTCKVGETNIALAMVERGWAVAFIQFGADYVLEELQARKAKRGLWAGEFEQPSDYRKRMRNVQSDIAGGQTQEPD